MNRVSLWQAWALWLSGDSPHEMYLWGMKILWWGRIGKFVAFAASLTIIADIIGPERLRIFGNKLHTQFTLSKAKAMVLATLKWYWGFMKAFGRAFLGKKFNLGTDEMLPASCFALTLGYALTGVLVYYVWSSYNWWRLIIIGWLGLVIFTCIFAPLTTVALALLFTISGLLIDMLLIEPIAYILEIGHLDRWLKIGSLLLIFIGFHFDLLAS
jgi:hypothetical protein